MRVLRTAGKKSRHCFWGRHSMNILDMLLVLAVGIVFNILCINMGVI